MDFLLDVGQEYFQLVFEQNQNLNINLNFIHKKSNLKKNIYLKPPSLSDGLFVDVNKILCGFKSI
jgi:hypothetical protein